MIQNTRSSANETNTNYHSYDGTITDFGSGRGQQYPVRSVFSLTSDIQTPISHFRLMFPPRQYLSLCSNISSTSLISRLAFKTFNATASIDNKGQLFPIALLLTDESDNQLQCSSDDKMTNIRNINQLLLPQSLYVKYLLMKEGKSLDNTAALAQMNITLIYAAQNVFEDIMTTMRSYYHNNTSNDSSQYLFDEPYGNWEMTLMLHC
jgi:hypothetical protein